MFTGIVQGLCRVEALKDETNLRRLRIALGELAEGAETGASVAINGTCLTITGIEPGGIVLLDVIQETLLLTNLGALQQGTQVNVERSFRVGDEVGGHILSGHVADQVTIRQVEESENQRDITFDVADRWMKYLHHKGFVALDGASLTLAEVDHNAGTIRVSLIPETITRTRLGTLTIGERVNLEIDAQTQAIVDTVERLVQTPEIMARLGVSRD